ncbi:MAG: proton-conducting transporter membrane subunit, partial [Limnochordia bacterium]|nr:proton-conducting transporter membrane subunit [Limnochordia bacterium]
SVWQVAATIFSKTSPLNTLEWGIWQFRADPLALSYALIAGTLWVLTAIYSYGYMPQDPRQRSFYAFFLLSMGITLGIAFAGNLLVLYIFYELLTFSTYPLVIHRRSEEALRAGKKYIIYSLVGAGALLVAIVATGFMAGSLSFGTGAILDQTATSGKTVWLLILFVIGFGVKAALMPLHRWLPQAMVAPTPVSALLHAVAVVNAGVFGLLRVVYSVFGPDLLTKLGVRPYLLVLASFTVLAGSIVALRQDVLKKRLAYSTISQLSYMLVGAFTLSSFGLSGAIFHMLNHSIIKITLFFCAGAIEHNTGKTRVSELAGLGRTLPWTFALFGIASLGMVGMLPVSAFWSKYYLMKAGLSSGNWPLLLVFIISGILNACYFFPIVIQGFLGTGPIRSTEGNKETYLMLVPCALLVVFALVLGVYPNLAWSYLVDGVVGSFF